MALMQSFHCDTVCMYLYVPTLRRKEISLFWYFVHHFISIL